VLPSLATTVDGVGQQLAVEWARELLERAVGRRGERLQPVRVDEAGDGLVNGGEVLVRALGGGNIFS